MAFLKLAGIQMVSTFVSKKKGLAMRLIDTHQHLLYRGKLRYDWTDDLPALAKKEFTIGDYQNLTRDHDIAASIFMEVDASDYREETRSIAKLAHDPANRIAGLVSSCRPETDQGFDAWLDECGELPVVGFRRILHEAPDDLSRSDVFRKNVRKIGGRGQVFDMVYRADQLTIAREFAEACDDMNLVLDHCGVPDIAGGDSEIWRKGVSGLAQLPHVSCKISGVLAYCAQGEGRLETIHPYIEHVIDSFGADRLVWGSDWPVVNLNSDLPQWIDMFTQIMAELSTDEAQAISFENAQRIYKLSV